MFEFWSILRLFFIKMNSHGEALPERRVADTCHDHSLVSLFFVDRLRSVNLAIKREAEFRLRLMDVDAY